VRIFKRVKLNRVPMIPLKITYLESYFEEEKRKIEVPSIELDIFLDFYRNLEHRENYIYSFVEYNGMKACVGFYDMRQATEALHKLANYLYKTQKLKP